MIDIIFESLTKCQVFQKVLIKYYIQNLDI